MSRLLLLSQSGIAADAAQALKERLSATPAARKHDLGVWFGDAGWALVQKPAGDEGKPLIPISNSDEQVTVKIAHEVLVIAWSYFPSFLQEPVDERGDFEALIPRAQGWSAGTAPEERTKRLTVGADLERFDALAERDTTGFPKLRSRS